MPPATPSAQASSVKQRIVEYLRDKPFERAIEQPEFKRLLTEEAHSDKPLYSTDTINAFEDARELRRVKRSRPTVGAFFSNKSVLIVPGFMGSQLRDDAAGGNGLIWIDPEVYLRPDELSALRLAEYEAGQPESDFGREVSIREDGAVPLLYAGLKYYLESGRCEVRTAGFDWRKDIDESAARLANTIQSFANEHPRRPFFLIAHSQGSLVARRALQFLGKEQARRIVNRLILLGPASYGTFAAAFAVAGNHSSIEALARYGLRWPVDTPRVLQSMSGLYQMIPWKKGTTAMELEALASPGFWKSGVDKKRLAKFFKWGESLDTAFFNDRTSIILGDKPQTTSAVEFQDKILVATEAAHGDGTVTDDCARIVDVTDVARAEGADHMTLPLNPRVMQTVWRLINANLSSPALHAAAAKLKHGVALLPEPVSLFALAGMRRDADSAVGVPPPEANGVPAGAANGHAPPTPPPPLKIKPLLTGNVQAPPAPPARRLKVFSFDPLLAIDPDSMGLESIVLRLPWDDESADGAKLQPGPVGEYLEVVDYDPASRCFYPPVDLNHPNLLAQDGVPLSETDPQFHQQMVYAVGMATITAFEQALGRRVLWSSFGRLEGEFVRRLRIYPHALREANAYYDPNRKALLFGYFPARTKPGDKVLPRGLVFTCLSYDVVAHEMTHAILDGMHRYLLYASNPDVLAFHEAFADIVALFQHFSHPAVLRRQVARVAGKLDDESQLGQLAQQFGEAMGMHKALRNYLGRKVEQKQGKPKWEPIEPDPMLYESVREPHERGAILVAAMFTAFLTIYRSRTRDLMRIATEGSGLLAPGDLHPDLVNRLADEAAKAARHLLLMAIRALDYLPPVDMTFGDYLRALVTSDVDLVPRDGHLYRVAVLDAFRQWGIYPTDVKTLSVESLLWNPPEGASLKLDMELFREILNVGGGTLDLDRADLDRHQRMVRAQLHGWMRERFAEDAALAAEWGLDVSTQAPHTIARDGKKNAPLPKFEIHSVRRCRRVGPDEQERIDILIEVVQKRSGYLDPNDQQKADAGAPPEGGPDFTFRGGATLIVDPRAGRIRYAIRKSIGAVNRLNANRAFQSGHGHALGLRGNYFGADGVNPFPLLHASED